MKGQIIGLYSLLFLLFAGCVTIPAPAVKDNMGVVAIDVDLRLKGDLFNLFPGFVEPNTIFFARLDKSGKVYNQSELYMSNYFIGETAYLLNAKPGTYVAVGFRAYKKDKEENLYKKTGYTLFDILIPEKMIELTRVKVCSGRVSYMGEFHMVEPKFADRAKVVDRAQQHYYGKMIPLAYGDAYGKDYFKDKEFDLRNRAAIYSEINPTFGALLEYHDNSKKRIGRHLKGAHSNMKETKWEPIFRSSLEEKGCR